MLTSREYWPGRNFSLSGVGLRECGRGRNMLSCGYKFRKEKEQTDEAVKEKEMWPNEGFLRWEIIQPICLLRGII